MLKLTRNELESEFCSSYKKEVDDKESSEYILNNLEESIRDFLHEGVCRKFLNDIKVDLENVGHFLSHPVFQFGINELHGYNFFFIQIGGDWEEPVYCCMFPLKESQWGLYIPERGNFYCPKCRKAFGSCECENSNMIMMTDGSLTDEISELLIKNG